MIRFGIFALVAVILFAGTKDGSLSWITVLLILSGVAFLFWGASLIFGEDGWIARIRNDNKLSEEEKERLEFLREYNVYSLFNRNLREMDSAYFDKMIREDTERKEYWELQKQFWEIYHFVFEGKGSEAFKDMAKTRISKIQAHDDSQRALNWLG